MTARTRASRILSALARTPNPFPGEARALQEADSQIRAAQSMARTIDATVGVRATNLRVMGRMLEDALDALGAAMARWGEHPSAAIARCGSSREAFRETAPLELLRYPWLANRLVRNIESQADNPHDVPAARYRDELHELRVSIKAVEYCGRAFRKARAEQRQAAEDLQAAQDDWEVCYLALRRRARFVPGMSAKLFGK